MGGQMITGRIIGEWAGVKHEELPGLEVMNVI
jgi:hypothetical protein